MALSPTLMGQVRRLFDVCVELISNVSEVPMLALANITPVLARYNEVRGDEVIKVIDKAISMVDRREGKKTKEESGSAPKPSQPQPAPHWLTLFACSHLLRNCELLLVDKGSTLFHEGGGERDGEKGATSEEFRNKLVLLAKKVLTVTVSRQPQSAHSHLASHRSTSNVTATRSFALAALMGLPTILPYVVSSSFSSSLTSVSNNLTVKPPYPPDSPHSGSEVEVRGIREGGGLGLVDLLFDQSVVSEVVINLLGGNNDGDDGDGVAGALVEVPHQPDSSRSPHSAKSTEPISVDRSVLLASLLLLVREVCEVRQRVTIAQRPTQRRGSFNNNDQTRATSTSLAAPTSSTILPLPPHISFTSLADLSYLTSRLGGKRRRNRGVSKMSEVSGSTEVGPVTAGLLGLLKLRMMSYRRPLVLSVLDERSVLRTLLSRFSSLVSHLQHTSTPSLMTTPVSLTLLSPRPPDLTHLIDSSLCIIDALRCVRLLFTVSSALCAAPHLPCLNLRAPIVTSLRWLIQLWALLVSNESRLSHQAMQYTQSVTPRSQPLHTVNLPGSMGLTIHSVECCIIDLWRSCVSQSKFDESLASAVIDTGIVMLDASEGKMTSKRWLHLQFTRFLPLVSHYSPSSVDSFLRRTVVLDEPSCHPNPLKGDTHESLRFVSAPNHDPLLWITFFAHMKHIIISPQDCSRPRTSSHNDSRTGDSGRRQESSHHRGDDVRESSTPQMCKIIANWVSSLLTPHHTHTLPRPIINDFTSLRVLCGLCEVMGHLIPALRLIQVTKEVRGEEELSEDEDEAQYAMREANDVGEVNDVNNTNEVSDVRMAAVRESEEGEVESLTDQKKEEETHPPILDEDGDPPPQLSRVFGVSQTLLGAHHYQHGGNGSKSSHVPLLVTGYLALKGVIKWAYLQHKIDDLITISEAQRSPTHSTSSLPREISLPCQPFDSLRASAIISLIVSHAPLEQQLSTLQTLAVMSSLKASAVSIDHKQLKTLITLLCLMISSPGTSLTLFSPLFVDIASFYRISSAPPPKRHPVVGVDELDDDISIFATTYWTQRIRSLWAKATMRLSALEQSQGKPQSVSRDRTKAAGKAKQASSVLDTTASIDRLEAECDEIEKSIAALENECEECRCEVTEGGGLFSTAMGLSVLFDYGVHEDRIPCTSHTLSPSVRPEARWRASDWVSLEEGEKENLNGLPSRFMFATPSTLMGVVSFFALTFKKTRNDVNESHLPVPIWLGEPNQQGSNPGRLETLTVSQKRRRMTLIMKRQLLEMPPCGSYPFSVADGVKFCSHMACTSLELHLQKVLALRVVTDPVPAAETSRILQLDAGVDVGKVLGLVAQVLRS
eukprot:GHVN01018551.1.p1 GENE.GHVN01018551.1~~GHVN01018551.1.p1  ORF type:complete len:1464 (-),score=358.51 GHVN01018551.1:4-4029(-)